jgi:uncharacterized protein (DUF58 family)
VDTVIPARSGRRHVLQLLRAMQSRPQPRRAVQTDLGELLHTAAQLVRRRSLVFVVSDFMSVPGWSDALGRLARRHETIAVRLYDPLESELPDLGMLVIRDAETGEELFVDTHDSEFRSRFAQAAERRENALRAAFRDAGVDALELSTEDDLADCVLRFADAKRRSRRLRRHELSMA